LPTRSQTLIPDWYVESAKRHAQELIASQVLEDHTDAGGFRVNPGGWCDGRQTAYSLNILLGMRCHAEAFALDTASLDTACEAAMSFLTRRQAIDGRIDLNGTLSANETGFPLPGLAAAYRHLPSRTPALFDRLAKPMRDFMVRGAAAVLEGEPSTANHRWAAHAAPLAAVHQLFPDTRYLRRIEDLLADGIDCDDDGFWYEERSPNYNMVANHGLLVLADTLGRDDLLDHVIRNCRLMLDLLQPNGEADSSTSFRQDRGRADRPAATYRVARRAAMLTGDGRLTRLAEHVRGVTADEALMPMAFEWLDHPGEPPSPDPLPERVERSLARGSIVRWREHDTSLTLAADPGEHFFDTVRDQWGGIKRSEDWFHLHCGDIVLQSIRFTLSYGRSIQPSELKQSEPGAYELVGACDGWPHTAHFRPGSPVTQTPQCQRHRIRVDRLGPRLRVRLDCDSADALWGALAFYIRPGIHAEGCGELKAGRQYALRATDLKLRSSRHALTITGLPDHGFNPPGLPPSQIPGSVERDCACLTVATRLPTAFDFSIRW
jgi:hypothetical protein